MTADVRGYSVPTGHRGEFRIFSVPAGHGGEFRQGGVVAAAVPLPGVVLPRLA